MTIQEKNRTMKQKQWTPVNTVDGFEIGGEG